MARIDTKGLQAVPEGKERRSVNGSDLSPYLELKTAGDLEVVEVENGGIREFQLYKLTDK